MIPGMAGRLHPNCRVCKEILAEYRRLDTLRSNNGSGLPHNLDDRERRLVCRTEAHLTLSA